MYPLSPATSPADQLSYQLLVDSVKEYAIFMLDPEGRVVSWNQGAERIKGYQAHEIIGQHFSCFYLPEDVHLGKPETGLQRALLEGKFEAEGWRLRRDGRRFWASVVITPLFAPDGSLTGYAKVTRDLTERRQAEETLRANEAKLRAIMEHAADGIVTTDENGFIQSINPAGANLFGYPPEALIGRDVSSLIPEPDGSEHDHHVRRYRQSGEAHVIGKGTREVVGRHHDGHPILLEMALSETMVQGQRTFIGIIRDITGRKRQEAVLKAANNILEAHVQERSAQWRAIFENGPAGMAKIDLSGRWLEVNQQLCHLTGYNAAELKCMSWRDLASPEDLADAMAWLQKLLAGAIDTYTREKVFIRKDGSTIAVESSLSLVRDASGQPLYFIGIATDMTERKSAEAARLASEAAYRTIFEQAGVGIAHVNLVGRVIRANQKFADILGYRLPEINGITLQAFVHPLDLPKKLALRHQLLSGERPSYVIEQRVVRKDGTLAWVRQNVSIGYEAESGQPTHTIGIVEDITAQKLVEQALTESQRRLKVAVQASGLGIWELDAATQQCWMSANAAAMLGYPAVEQVLPRAVVMRQVHPDDQTMAEARMDHTAALGSVQQADYRVIWPNGETRWLASAVQAIRNAEGNIVKFIGASLDITTRKQAEQQLRQLSIHLQDIREDERKRVAREIHDELGGALTAIKFDLTLPGWQEEAQAGEGIARHTATVAQVDAAIAALRRIISDLRPSVLDDLGVWAALEWQAQEFAARTGIRCTYRLLGPETEIAPEVATAVFRMVQEALTNVLRHAQASKVTVRARVTTTAASIRIEDNGVGICTEKIANNRSYGLLGMQERARQINGTVRVFGKPGKGTAVYIWLPLGSK
jgi:PAS domain S-box-containing protein